MFYSVYESMNCTAVLKSLVLIAFKLEDQHEITPVIRIISRSRADFTQLPKHVRS